MHIFTNLDLDLADLAGSSGTRGAACYCAQIRFDGSSAVTVDNKIWRVTTDPTIQPVPGTLRVHRLS